MTKLRDVQPSMFPDIAPDKPIGRILPSVFVGTNAELMAAVSDFYLTGSVLDVTYGEGKWWDRYKPNPFTAHDLYKLDGVDFRALPEANASVDTVCFDPPYVNASATAPPVKGKTAEFHDRFGLQAGLSGVIATILDGLDEVLRVAARFALVKCQEIGDADRFHDVPQLVTQRALDCGWSKWDQIVHHTGSGPGGNNIFDPRRSRRHHSYLIVFAKP